MSFACPFIIAFISIMRNTNNNTMGLSVFSNIPILSQCHYDNMGNRTFHPKITIQSWRFSFMVNYSFKTTPLFHIFCRWRVSQTENGSTSKACTMTDKLHTTALLWFHHDACGLLQHHSSHLLTILSIPAPLPTTFSLRFLLNENPSEFVCFL